MKKPTIILMLFAIVLSVPCLAQSNIYYSFPNTNAWWSEVTGSIVYEATDYDYYVRGDTIVNGKTYFKINISGGWKSRGGYQSYDSLECLLREDTVAKKIYVSFKPTLGKDTLLYDFNLKVGDTLPVSYDNSAYGIRYVKSIDSILIGSHYRKSFILGSNLIPPSAPDSLIEGIGSSSGLLEPIEYPNGYSYQLSCFRENDTAVYPFLNDSCQIFVLGLSSINKDAATINVYPNPSTGQFTLALSHAELVSASQPIVEIYNMLGQKIYSNQLLITNYSLLINLSSQPNGVYLYRLIDENSNLIGQGKLVIEK